LASGEVVVRVNGRLFYLWRAIDHEGEVLDAVVPTTRDKRAALTVLKLLQKRYGRPRHIVTDGLPAYAAAMKEICVVGRHCSGR
jgi:putative transposase